VKTENREQTFYNGLCSLPVLKGRVALRQGLVRYIVLTWVTPSVSTEHSVVVTNEVSHDRNSTSLSLRLSARSARSPEDVCGSSSVVERQPSKLRVAGSNPVSRS
jgi:hypothetical protein